MGWSYNDVIVYVTVIRMAFTLTDQHRVASFDCQRWWYSPFTHFWSKMSGRPLYEFVPSLTYCHDAHFLQRVESKWNRNCNSRLTEISYDLSQFTGRVYVRRPAQFAKICYTWQRIHQNYIRGNLCNINDTLTTVSSWYNAIYVMIPMEFKQVRDLLTDQELAADGSGYDSPL